MRQRTIWLSSFFGAAAALLFDPTSGRRRRHRLSDATAHLIHRTTGGASTVGRDLRNRSRGLIATTRQRFARDHPDEAVLEERVHSALGRAVTHPHAITVTVKDGRVTLDGPIAQGEEKRVANAVRAVPGVRDVETRFNRHIQPAYDPGSDVARPHARTPSKPDLLQRNWAPATRALIAASGAGLVGAGLTRRDRAGIGLAVTGAALIARAATNIPVSRLVGIGGSRRPIDVQKTITVDLPVDRVFAFWEDPANLPTLMHHVRDVRPTNEPGHWRWTLSGPAGVPIEFETVLTDRVHDALLAWTTVEGSTVEHAGTVRFDPLDADRTRVSVRLSYNSPGGALAHGVLTAVGADPKSRLDNDLAHMKAALETEPHSSVRG